MSTKNKMIKTYITQEEWLKLKPYVEDHYGEIAYILRQAIREYLKKKQLNGGGGDEISRRGRTTKTEAHPHR